MKTMFSAFEGYKVWFFDLDGTLADTDGDIRAAWKAALADLGITCENFDRDFVAGPPIEKMAEMLFPDRCDAATIAALRERFGVHYDNDGFPTTREYPGVLDAVKALKARGATVIIVTNKRYVGATAMARHFGWDRIFDGVFAGDMYKDTPIGKLTKGALLGKIIAERGYCAADCVLVGDTSSDFKAAEENGIASIAVPWGYGRPDELAMAGTLLK